MVLGLYEVGCLRMVLQSGESFVYQLFNLLSGRMILLNTGDFDVTFFEEARYGARFTHS
jgi:hypothetical protein